jgi:nucleotide-binding universal stress UspA family protein
VAAGYHHIACCIDTSEAADAAVSQAGALRDGTATRLSLVHVAPPEEVMRGGITEWEIDEADPLSPPRRWLAERAASSDATPVLLCGEPAHREACRWLAAGDADLVVAAAHSGRVARTLLGGFATALAHDAPVDTLIVPPRGAIQAPSHIACAVDDDGGSAGAVDAALRVAAATGARVSVVHAISPPRPLPRNLVAGNLPVPAGRQARADELVRDTADAIPGAESVVVTGAPEDAISDWCREAGVDLLVVGPRSGRRAGLGGFAARIIRQAPCGVLLARDPAAGGDAQA